MIQLAGRVLAAHCNPNRDFIGHIGGDDFIILFQSEDWEVRCGAVLDALAYAIAVHYDSDDRQRGGYNGEDRRGRKVFHLLLSVSLGVVRVEPGQFLSPHQISTAAADAKKQAKKIPGNSLFIEHSQGVCCGRIQHEGRHAAIMPRG